MKLVLRVPADRSIAGVLTVQGAAADVDGSRPLEVLACATATDARNHPAFGRYRYRELRVNEEREVGAVGRCRLVFEPEAGDALAAEARGFLTLEVLGGAPGPDGRLRRTGRGVRVSDADLLAIVSRLPTGARVTLDLQAEEVSRWRWIERWRRRLSEVTPGVERDDASPSSSPSRSSRDDDTSSTGSSGWSGGGGSFGGAGSSGSWSDGAGASGARAAATVGAVAAGAAVAASAAGRSADGDRAGSDADEAVPASGTSY